MSVLIILLNLVLSGIPVDSGVIWIEDEPSVSGEHGSVEANTLPWLMAGEQGS